MTSSVDARPKIYPQVQISESSGGMLVTLTDAASPSHIELMANGRFAPMLDYGRTPGLDTWIWRWQLQPSKEDVVLEFYHSCNVGCVLWTTTRSGSNALVTRSTQIRKPTKLGLVFPSASRDWHLRGGWAVELVYVAKEYSGYTLHDLAERVGLDRAKGLRILVRVDFDRGQTLPSQNDLVGLNTYLEFLSRLASDDRFGDVYGLIIGSGPNDNGSNAQGLDKKITPEWYARVFNGYGDSADRADNAAQIIHVLHPELRVLVGPVRPWNTDQNGGKNFAINAPWLNYMNTLTAAIDQSARDKSLAGFASASPDGFAIQASGRPDAPELIGLDRAKEPLTDLRRAEWGGAQAGFRMYQDWLSVINSYSVTQNLPVFITSANTFIASENMPPAQNYPRGWLPNAYGEINSQPQIHSLCWFIDELPGDPTWDLYSLGGRKARLMDADQDFDSILTRK